MLILHETELQGQSGNHAFILGRLCELWRKYKYTIANYDLAIQECRNQLDVDNNTLCFVVKGATTISIWRVSTQKEIPEIEPQPETSHPPL